MVPKVDTFEHDIADEIRRKEASLAEIQAVSKQSSPTIQTPVPTKKPWTVIILGVLLVVSLLGIGGVAYYYFNDSLLPPSSQEVAITKKDLPKVATDLAKLSPTLETSIGRFVSGVEKKDGGYILTITNYSAVFGYMTRNEDIYVTELAAVFTGTTPATSTPKVAVASTTTPTTISTSTQPVATTTKTTLATSTKQVKKTTKVASSTPVSTTTVEIVTTALSTPEVSHFSDLTLTNQNMRVYKKDTSTVVYAFVGDKNVLISNSPEGILALKSVILRK